MQRDVQIKYSPCCCQYEYLSLNVILKGKKYLVFANLSVHFGALRFQNKAYGRWSLGRQVLQIYFVFSDIPNLQL